MRRFPADGGMLMTQKSRQTSLQSDFLSAGLRSNIEEVPTNFWPDEGVGGWLTGIR